VTTVKTWVLVTLQWYSIEKNNYAEVRVILQPR
jgi:hypothetical protein